ncbi:MBL fold metallo-hydrolase [SAR86 cluster bacterium]|jgi:glyoxylase-like metal-dependent hydrolase (beta-lactamase superfamily II)|nr:MBL fold metallo-hydrolase [SAR86 cluster bacterium]|tara:strand:+ start:1053 stop:1718 length:666 start_codon:yes stop_codon:yes gene_type:complete
MAILKAAIITVTPFQQNCSVIWKEDTKIAAVTDPGGDLELIEKFIEDQNLTLSKIFITHGHLDHAAEAKALANKFNVVIEGPQIEDEFLTSTLETQGKAYGMPNAQNFVPDRWLNEGDQIELDGEKLDVYHCPGHTPGHVIFHHIESKLAIVGDVLFQGSVGRTDLPGGNMEALISAIREKLLPLGDDITFIPGHGPISTLGQERLTNPFVADQLFKESTK